jgi:hypothetical protein
VTGEAKCLILKKIERGDATMTIEIHQPELENLIQQRMKSGAFRSIEDVLMYALTVATAADSGDKSAANTVPSIAHLQKTDPEEWGRQFHAWAESHDRTTPLLSDEAISRDSIYPDRL